MSIIMNFSGVLEEPLDGSRTGGYNHTWFVYFPLLPFIPPCECIIYYVWSVNMLFLCVIIHADVTEWAYLMRQHFRTVFVCGIWVIDLCWGIKTKIGFYLQGHKTIFSMPMPMPISKRIRKTQTTNAENPHGWHTIRGNTQSFPSSICQWHWAKWRKKNRWK